MSLGISMTGIGTRMFGGMGERGSRLGSGTRTNPHRTGGGSTRIGGAPSTRSSSSGSSSSGSVAEAESFESILNRSLTAVMSALPGLDSYMRQSFTNALTAVMPDWQQRIFGTASNTIRNLEGLADSFRTNVLPGAMARVNELSDQAMTVVGSMLRGELPQDVSDEVRRLTAEMSLNRGIRGAAANNFTARDFGLTSMNIMERGLIHAPSATTLASNAYTGFANVLNTPMAAVGATANMLANLRPDTTNPSALLAAILGPALNQSQFGTNTTNQNYWNNVNAGAQRDAVTVAQNQLNSTQDFQRQLMDLQRQQMELQRNAMLTSLNNNTTGSTRTVTTGAPAPLDLSNLSRV